MAENVSTGFWVFGVPTAETVPVVTCTHTQTAVVPCQGYLGAITKLPLIVKLFAAPLKLLLRVYMELNLLPSLPSPACVGFIAFPCSFAPPLIAARCRKQLNLNVVAIAIAIVNKGDSLMRPP
ncbi:hypothetical protein L6164_000189 [Bauhinia variegata]|uniref:Uncharacterized protein n=1 Tax=Bauhinia variegata TaxID=167791 RepID=A0ACB9Q552_BAUVA|nr:hypothetical protein L6164_000189 [Bauhinia variegata]